MNHSLTAVAHRRLQPSFVTSSTNNTQFKRQQPSASRIQHGQTVEIKHACN